MTKRYLAAAVPVVSAPFVAASAVYDAATRSEMLPGKLGPKPQPRK
jgi:hypothetical protein